MTWTAEQVRHLRYRLGLSQAEMARTLSCELHVVLRWELGEIEPSENHQKILVAMLNQAESNSEKVLRRPVAEILMQNKGLCQIHDLEVIESLDQAESRDS